MPENLLEMLAESVVQYRTRPAVWNPDRDGVYQVWSYDELWRGIGSVGRWLLAEGVGAGSTVGLVSDSGVWWPLSDFAIMSVGAITVPIYPGLPWNQMEYIVAHSELCGIFIDTAAQLKKLLSFRAEVVPHLKFIVLFDDDMDPALFEEACQRWQLIRLSNWLQSESTVSLETWSTRWRRQRSDDVATIVYTSGTTGVPKGVILTHGNILANVEGVLAIVKMSPTDRSLSYLPLSHIFERTAGQFVPLSRGSSIAYSRGFRWIVEDFRRMPPTILTTVPRLLEKFYERVMDEVTKSPHWRQVVFRRALSCGTAARVHHRTVSRFKLSLYDRLVFHRLHTATGGRLRLIVVGGAPMPMYVATFFTAAGFSVIEGYGLTETSPVISVNNPANPRLGTCGRVLHNVDVKLDDDGELLVRGPSVTSGYHRNPAETEQAFTPDGWFRTGDMAELLPDGYLRITDRKKHLIVLSTGKKVTPAPIEADILKSEYVEHVLLIGQGEKFVSAVVVPSEAALARFGLSYRGMTLEQGTVLPSQCLPLAELLLAEVTRYTEDFARFEQPKQVVVADDPFTVENGELTPSLKVRGQDVVRHYESQIRALYEAHHVSDAAAT